MDATGTTTASACWIRPNPLGVRPVVRPAILHLLHRRGRSRRVSRPPLFPTQTTACIVNLAMFHRVHPYPELTPPSPTVINSPQIMSIAPHPRFRSWIGHHMIRTRGHERMRGLRRLVRSRLRSDEMNVVPDARGAVVLCHVCLVDTLRKDGKWRDER